jgi:ribose/xylose/arabinose/galactoside ABC-type transport system permease subunit
LLKTLFGSRAALLLGMCVLMTGFFTLKSKGMYLEWSNIRYILNTMVTGGYITTGAVFLVLTGCIDLAASQTAVLAGVVLAQLLAAGLPVALAIPATYAVAGCVGALSASLVHEVKIPPFVATLGVSYLVTGSALLLSSGFSTDISDGFIRWLGTHMIGGEVTVSLAISAVALTALAVILAKTKFGKTVYLVGGNPTAARLSGLNPRRVYYSAYIINSLLCATAGIIQVSKLGASSANSVNFGPFAGLTCAILGGVSFGGGAGGLGGAFAGLLLINGLSNGLSMIRVAPYWQSISSGGLLLVALTSGYLGARKRGAMFLNNS